MATKIRKIIPPKELFDEEPDLQEEFQLGGVNVDIPPGLEMYTLKYIYKLWERKVPEQLYLMQLKDYLLANMQDLHPEGEYSTEKANAIYREAVNKIEMGYPVDQLPYYQKSKQMRVPEDGVFAKAYKQFLNEKSIIMKAERDRGVLKDSLAQAKKQAFDMSTPEGRKAFAKARQVGFVTPAMNKALREGLITTEEAQDWAQLTPQEIVDYGEQWDEAAAEKVKTAEGHVAGAKQTEEGVSFYGPGNEQRARQFGMEAQKAQDAQTRQAQTDQALRYSKMYPEQYQGFLQSPEWKTQETAGFQDENARLMNFGNWMNQAMGLTQDTENPLTPEQTAFQKQIKERETNLLTDYGNLYPTYQKIMQSAKPDEIKPFEDWARTEPFAIPYYNEVQKRKTLRLARR